LINECSSEQGSTNCANNNAETIGDENIISPQVTQSSQVETGSGGPPRQLDQPVLGANLVFGRTVISIPPGEQAGGIANCLSDTVAIGGAYHGSGAPGIFVYGNTPSGGDPDVGIPPTGWFIAAFNAGPEFQSFTIDAICSPIVN
jgi:hypothetical protein